MSSHLIGLFLLATVSGSMMAISQKMLAGISPYRTYVIANGVAFLCSIAAWWIVDRQAPTTRSRWMIGLGIALFVLNMSYIRLYHQNIHLAYVPVIVTGLITIVLLVVGYMVFQESISRQSAMGIVVVGIGLRLITSS